MKLFSRKLQPQPDSYSYAFPERVRIRILLAFQHLAERDHSPSGSFQSLLDDVGKSLAREYGGLCYATNALARIDDPTLDHFAQCSDAHVIDFILVAFRSCHYRAGQQGVDEINRILREEAIGYEFTDYVTCDVEKPDSVSPWGKGEIGTFIEVDYPEVVEKCDEYTHDAVVKPCLSVLAKPIFKVANHEMLKAHEHVRKGNFDDAVTSCGAAYESVMKTLLTAKRWAFAAKDTCAPLVDALIREGLVPGFYAETLKSPGRIRNNVSSAHGRGPAPNQACRAEDVDHMIQITSANILLLVRLAGI